MPIAVICSLALLFGVAGGTRFAQASGPFVFTLIACAAGATTGYAIRSGRLVLITTVVGALCGGAALGCDAREHALHTNLREVLAREDGGYAIDALVPPRDAAPFLARATLLSDAIRDEGVVRIQCRVEALRIRGSWTPASGDVSVSVGGDVQDDRLNEWRAGRTIEAPVIFRRPARYLNDGVPDFERDLALDGTTLFGSVKSGWLVDVRARGSLWAEYAATVRAFARRSIGKWVGRFSELSASIVTAIVIGDRSGLPDDVRDRLQTAGTYHVLAISGGNIALFAGACFGMCTLLRGARWLAPSVTMLALLGYAGIVTAGPSVWRAVLMALLYLCARLLDHRTAVWQAVSAAAGVLAVLRPLDVGDPAFLLTFGATVALLETGRRLPWRRHRSGAVRWLTGAVVASLAVELALLPVAARTFSRITIAGILLNLVAVPAMAVAQVAGTLVVVGSTMGPGPLAGWAAHLASSALVSSARLVDVAPWLAVRVPPPVWLAIGGYYVALLLSLFTRGAIRGIGVAGLIAAILVIVSGWRAAPAAQALAGSAIRLTMFDVGQGESLLLETSPEPPLLVDAAGPPFGSGFDIGARVLAPALWARGVRTLGPVLITHGDPDHLGGAAAILEDFVPSSIWEGIPVPTHRGLQRLHEQMRRRATESKQVFTPDRFTLGNVTLRILHPAAPDWERRRVRNDDSVVIEVLHGDVALLLTGDISADVERAIVPQLTPARVRVLKVAHHGSRTSTSQQLLQSWRPQIALISCGRGNSFGHPSREVVSRLEESGAAIYRTDRDGEITLESDGRSVRVATYVRTHAWSGRSP